MRIVHALVAVLALVTGLVKSEVAHAQHQYDRWYFGFKQGLDFRTSPPTVLTDGQTNTIEGSAVYCDPKTGDLLFYTDGTMVWDRLHRLMPGGKDLIADQSSTQAALIVPDPAEPKRFYLFHSDQSGYAQPTKGVYYSVIDLRMNGGYGDVAIKNQKLIHEGTEKLTAISLCGGEAYWVIAHELITNNYLSWFVDVNGLSQTPVRTSIGVNAGPSPVAGAGYLTASPNGQMLAAVIPQPPSVEVFKFDFESGTLRDRIELPPITKPYGISFSPDNTKLYVIGDKELAQYDISEYDSTLIAKSRFRMKHTNRSEGALRLGPNKKIYVQESDSLGVINNPNMAGDACGYTPSIYPLKPSGQFGLPNNIDALGGHDCKVPLARIARHQTNICESTCISFKDSSRNAPTSWVWLFEGATPSTSREKNPTNICYNKEGTYNVTLIAYNDSGSDTARSIVRVKACPLPVVALRDTTLCISECVTFKDTSTLATSWQWTFENGQPSTYSGKTPGQVCFYRTGKQKVTLVASNQYGYSTATAIVDVRNCKLPIAKFTHDTVVCPNLELAFTNQSTNASTTYEWYFEGGVPSKSFNRDPGKVYYQSPGEYKVSLIARNENGVDTMASKVRVTACVAPSARLNDYTICEGDCIWLEDSSTGDPTNWEWTIDGGSVTYSTLRSPGNVCFKTAGVYAVRLISGNANGSDTVTRKVTVQSSSPKAISNLILADAIPACSAIDTAIWIQAGCNDLQITNITSKAPLKFERVQYTIASGTTVRIPMRLQPNEPGGMETSVNLEVDGKQLIVPLTYSSKEADEAFALSFSTEPFVAGYCTPASRSLVIRNDACTPQTISKVAIVSSTASTPFRTDFVNAASIVAGTEQEILVTFDPTLPGSKEAMLVVTTAAGKESRFVLQGVRNELPKASVGLGQPSSASLVAGDQLKIAVQFESEIGDSVSPEDVQLTLGYDSDVLSFAGISTPNGWTVVEASQAHGTLRLRLSRPSAYISAAEALAVLTFNSFVAQEESTSLTINEVTCDRDDAGYSSCGLDAEIGQSSSVTITGECGITELRKALHNTKALSISVHPNPIISREGDLMVAISSSASEANPLPLLIELIDLHGKPITLMYQYTLRTDQEEIRLKATDLTAGSYTLRTRVGSEATSTQVIVTQ